MSKPTLVAPAGQLSSSTVDAIREIDCMVQNTHERIATLCRSAKQRLIVGDQTALADVHELLSAIGEASQEAEDYVNAECERLGGCYVDMKRRDLRDQLQRREGGAS